MPAVSNFVWLTARPIHICFRPPSWPADWMALRMRAIPASGSTSTCIPTAHNVNDAKKLPLNLLDALRDLEQSSLLKKAFGEVSSRPI